MRRVVAIGVLIGLSGCAFEVTDKPDPVRCILVGVYCSCTGTVDTPASLSDAQERCNALRAADGGS